MTFELGRKLSFKDPNILGVSLIQLLLPFREREQMNCMHTLLVFSKVNNKCVSDGQLCTKSSDLCITKVQCLHRTTISEWYT